MNIERVIGGMTLAAAVFLLCSPFRQGSAAAPDRRPGLLLEEFVFESAPFAQCHASTIAQTRGGLLAAWFAGTQEGDDDVGIWIAHEQQGGWTAPRQVADGRQQDQRRYPCWNPVLFQVAEGPLLLFYKVGPSPRSWWGMLIQSEDGGGTWSEPRRLPAPALGPIKNKPVMLEDGTLLCGSSTEHDGWRIHMERTADLGRTFQIVGPLDRSGSFGAIQPAILNHGSGRLQILCRSQQRHITECWSSDGGKTWSPMAATSLPNPNSGIDAVTLGSGSHLLVYNHTRQGRSPLNVAISDDGKHWKAALVLENEPGEYSYPAVIQTADGRVHITYTWKRRRIKHVVVDPNHLHLTDIPGGGSLSRP